MVDEDNWQKTIGATTAPHGYEWWNNGESRFSGKRKMELRPKEEEQ